MRASVGAAGPEEPGPVLRMRRGRPRSPGEAEVSSMPPRKDLSIADEVPWEALAAVSEAAEAAVRSVKAQEWTAWDQDIAAEVFGPAARQVQVTIHYRVYDQHPGRR
jgi:hypothetical protein